MNSRVNSTIVSNETVATDGDAAAIHEIGVMIYKRIMPYMAVTAIIYQKWRKNDTIFS